MNRQDQDYCVGCCQLLPASLLEPCSCGGVGKATHRDAVWCESCFQDSHYPAPDPMDLAKEVRSGNL